MQFLKTAFWVVLAVAVALFCKANNKPVEIKLWADFVWETKKWFPILLAFVLGALPFWTMARATRWRYKKRLESAERALANTAITAPPPPVVATPTEPKDISAPAGSL